LNIYNLFGEKIYFLLNIELITGSNMSGKATFIRTLGINLSLAYAGSFVNMVKLEVSLFEQFTCIKISDSIKDGISYFYAEVKRLKSMLDKIEKSEYPVFFLIDEIFRGTNDI
jgi:DNA mismatch repair ATPase MutS